MYLLHCTVLYLIAYMLQSRHRPSFASEQRRGDATGTGRIPIRNVCNVPMQLLTVRYLTCTCMRKLHKKATACRIRLLHVEHHHYYYLTFWYFLNYVCLRWKDDVEDGRGRRASWINRRLHVEVCEVAQCGNHWRRVGHLLRALPIGALSDIR